MEVTRTTAAKDRRLARVYGPGGIPVYWIVNVPKRELEVYTDPDPAVGYRSRVDYRPGQDVPVIIDGQEVGRIPVAELLPGQGLRGVKPRGFAASSPVNGFGTKGLRGVKPGKRFRDERASRRQAR